MTSQVNTLSTSFTATGAYATTTQIANSKQSLYVGGTFSGTVQLTARPTGNSALSFEPLTPVGATTPNITAGGVYAYPSLAGDYEFQLLCTAFTSGTIVCEAQMGPSL